MMCQVVSEALNSVDSRLYVAVLLSTRNLQAASFLLGETSRPQVSCLEIQWLSC